MHRLRLTRVSAVADAVASAVPATSAAVSAISATVTVVPVTVRLASAAGVPAAVFAFPGVSAPAALNAAVAAPLSDPVPVGRRMHL